ncbi:MAG: ADP-forming succinate--CoA ligase subunit beta, partial [Sphingomonadales bacterium]
VEEAVAAAKQLPGPLYVVKSQIHAGGRGKGKFKELGPDAKGGVRLAKSIDEVEAHAKDMLGNTLVTIQTGPEGKQVNRLYITDGADIKKEFYLALLVDRATSRIALVASTEGGMDIEEVAHNTPEKIHTITIDPATGLMPHHGRSVAHSLGLTGDLAKQASKVVAGLYAAFLGCDAEQIEINPLAVCEGTNGDELLVLDAKVGFDGNAMFRHKDLAELRDLTEEDPAEVEASEYDLAYIKLDGNIGCMVNGAGLAMATMDIIKLNGEFPANFLDVGGGANKEKVTAAFKIILKDPAVKGILVNIFGGIMKCDIIADGIVAAAKEVNLSVPLVVRLEGTNVQQGKDILANSGLPIVAANDLGDAAKKIVAEVRKVA